jgi:hypothetical protein
MAPSDSTPKNELGAFEYELTDLTSARHALDEMPAGVEEIKRLKPGYWETRRRTPLPTDRALAGTTLEWLGRLPAEFRPSRMVERYPRVVNHIAETWYSAARCQQTFEDLLIDHRGGRHGFPLEVETELKRLRHYRAGLRRS